MHNTSSLSLFFFHLWALSAVQQSIVRKMQSYILIFYKFSTPEQLWGKKKVYIVQRSRKKGGRKRGIISHLEKLNI
jgi:hypothetical protein